MATVAGQPPHSVGTLPLPWICPFRIHGMELTVRERLLCGSGSSVDPRSPPSRLILRRGLGGGGTAVATFPEPHTLTIYALPIMTYDEYQDFKDRIRRAEGTPEAVELFRELEGIAAQNPADRWIHYLLGFARRAAWEVDQSVG